MEGCGGEWFGVPVPRLFLYVGALHPIRRQCTSSVRVHRHVTGAPPRNGCSAPVLVAVVAAVGVAGVFCAWVVFRAWGVFCLGVFRLLGLGCLLLGGLPSAGLGLSSAWVFVAPHVVVPQKCRTQFPDMYFKR